MLKTVHHVLKRHYHNKYHQVYHHAKKLFIFDIILVILSAVFLVAGLFFFFWKPNITELIDLSLSIGNNRIKSGDKIVLTVRYANHSKERLEKTTLAFKLPAGFVLDPQNLPTDFQKNSTFEINTLEPGASGEIQLTGRLWGEINQPEKILGVLAYHPGSEPTIEQKLTPLIINLPDSILSGTLDMATTTFPNQKIPFTYRITNSSDLTIQNLHFKATADTPIKLTTSSTVFSLNPGESKVFSGEITTKKTPAFSLTTLTQIDILNMSFVQNSLHQTVGILVPTINTTLKINKGTEYLEPNQTFPVVLDWKNNSSLQLKNIQLKISNRLGLINLTATAKANNLKTDGTALIIDKTNHPTFALSLPGSGDSIPLNITLISKFGKKIPEDTKNFLLESVITTEVEKVNGQTYTQTGDSLSLPLATELNLDAQVRYYTPEGDQLGRGPLPPKVGQITKYWVFARVLNTINSVNNIHFAATLAPNITFTGKQSVTIGPSLRQIGNKIVWDYAELPAFSETGLFFEVSAQPTEKNIGQALPLIENITVSATDPNVNKELKDTRGLLNNTLSANDLGSKLSNKVRP